jgi:hypothetical protein
MKFVPTRNACLEGQRSQSFWEVLGHSSNALIEQQKEWKFPMPEKNYAASYIVPTAYTVCRTLCTNADSWKDKSKHQNQRRRGRYFPFPP